MAQQLSYVLLAAAALLLLCCEASFTFNNDQFKGKVVLLTGGSSGIGYQTALQFARAGAHVWFCSRDSHPSWYNGTWAALNIRLDPEVVSAGGFAKWVKADASNADQAKAFFDTVISTEGQVHYGVFNAGIGGPLGTIDTIRSYLRGENDPILNNVYGVANMMSLLVEYWVKTSYNGVIVNTASRDGLGGCPTGSLYSASKHAIIGLTKSVALEFAKGTPVIRVNALAPGLTDTPFTWNQVKWLDHKEQSWSGPLILPDDPLWIKYGPQWVAQLPNNKMAEPTDMANTILFLCSQEASYISGAVFSVDFGLAALQIVGRST